jgi:hypothetical protein
MRRSFAPLFAVLAAGLCASGAFADDAKTFTIPVHETWKVGDLVSHHDSDRQALTIKLPDGTVIEQKNELVEWVGVVKAEEVAADGQYSKALVYIEKWSRQEGDATDTSLSNVHVRVTGAPKARTVAVLTPGAKPSEAATKWLKNEFAKANEGEMDAAFNPGKPIAVGTSWSPDLTLLMKALSGPDAGMTVVADKSKATLTLTAVEEDIATMTLDMALQSGPLETPQGKMEWSDGGRFEIKAEVHKPLKAGDHHEAGKMAGSLKGTLNASGQAIVFDMAMEKASLSEPAESIPDVPGAK